MGVRHTLKSKEWALVLACPCLTFGHCLSNIKLFNTLELAWVHFQTSFQWVGGICDRLYPLL